MKKLVMVTLLFVILGVYESGAQDVGFSYQAVALDRSQAEGFGRDSEGQVLSNTAIIVRFSISPTSAEGEYVYQEIHQTQTDIFGMFRLIVGRGEPVSATRLMDLYWGDQPYFLHVEIDTGNGDFEYLGSEELLGSPYALNVRKQRLDIAGTRLSISEGNEVDLSQFYDDTRLSEQEVDAYVSNNGYLTAEQDGSVYNEIQDLQLTNNQLQITNNSEATSIDLSGYLDQLSEAEVDAYVSNNGYLTSEIDGSITNEIQDLQLIGNNLQITGNAGASIIDLSGYLDDTQLTESQVDAFVANNGYLTSEVDGSITNEIQDLQLVSNILTITGNTSPSSIDLSGYLPLTEAQVDAYANNNGYLTAEVDGSVTNEIQDLMLVGNTLSITNNASPTAIDLTKYNIFNEVSNVISNAPGNWQSNDFVFGSTQLNDDNSTTSDNARMFFDKSRGAFRTGLAEGSQWDESNLGMYSTAFGRNNTVTGTSSVGWGYGNILTGALSLVGGDNNNVAGSSSLVAGSYNTVTGVQSFAVGYQNQNNGNFSATFGILNSTSGSASVTFGNSNQATGNYSVVSGSYNRASGENSYALGRSTNASNISALASGSMTTASGINSVSFGQSTVASGEHSFALGASSRAEGNMSMAGGFGTNTRGEASFSHGAATTAKGYYTAAFGDNTVSESYTEIVIGSFNTLYTPNDQEAFSINDRLFVAGNGVASARSDAFVLYKNGNAWLSGTLTQSSDRRLKKDIQSLEPAMERLAKLRGVQFKWNDVRPHVTDEIQTGFIAQEVEALFPELVITDEQGYKSVNYVGLIPYLLEAIKELEKEKAMEKQALESRLQTLEDRISKMEQLINQSASSNK